MCASKPIELNAVDAVVKYIMPRHRQLGLKWLVFMVQHI